MACRPVSQVGERHSIAWGNNWDSPGGVDEFGKGVATDYQHGEEQLTPRHPGDQRQRTAEADLIWRAPEGRIVRSENDSCSFGELKRTDPVRATLLT